MTIGIVLALVFGSLCFYLYMRMSQNEKRVSLLESMLLTLKLSTEASLGGPDMVEPTSGPVPLGASDVDEVSEESYADLLKEIPASAVPQVVSQSGEVFDAPSAEGADADAEADAASLLRAMEAPALPARRPPMDANYESMNLKELQALARQRGLTTLNARKKELIDALKKQGEAPPVAPAPLAPAADELEGAVAGEAGFNVGLE